MNILLNNKPEKLFDGSTVKKLLENKNIKNKYYAVEINRKIIPKSDHETYIIKEGDKIEIIAAIGGG
jgi:thiamine biosynthesis protein ThiS